MHVLQLSEHFIQYDVETLSHENIYPSLHFLQTLSISQSSQLSEHYKHIELEI
jgi:hypothetical protein